MGKKVKNQEAKAEPAEQPAVDNKTAVVDKKIKPIEKYLPHEKYTLKRSKVLNIRKQECI